jgi:phosphoribosylformimino-5-aminoimidazole carboxamide ribotide isomerase
MDLFALYDLMQVIPAIDLQNGKCVRLYKGIKDQFTIYAEDPLEMLYYWENMGADFIHIVDLDAAFGLKDNRSIIKRMLKLASSRLEVGGGIRSLKSALELYSWGVERVILGTAAVKDASIVSALAGEIGSRHIMVALDYRGEKVLIKGWQTSTDLNVFQIGKVIEERKAGAILFSSAEDDGTLGGPDIPSIQRMITTVQIPIFAAGGIGSLADVTKVASTKVAGLVIGRALYEKKFSYSEIFPLLHS